MMLRDFLRYPSVLKKVTGVKCLILSKSQTLSPGKFHKNAPLKDLYFGSEKLRFGGIYKNLKVAFDCQSPCQKLCPRHISSK